MKSNLDDYKIKNFIPPSPGKVDFRPGVKPVPYKRRSFIKRIIDWWRGNPDSINSITEYQGVLYVATDRGLYFYNGKNLERVNMEGKK